MRLFISDQGSTDRFIGALGILVAMNRFQGFAQHPLTEVCRPYDGGNCSCIVHMNSVTIELVSGQN